MAFGDGDLPAFFADMGETAIVNGQTVTVFVDASSMPWEHGGIGSMEESIVKITGPVTAFNALPVPGQAVTMRGSNWTISRRSLPGDGRVVELELKAAS